MTAVRVVLPAHLRTLTGLRGELQLTVAEAPTIGTLLDALEQAHPVLRGTLRDGATGRRRPFVRFFACGNDLSHEPPATPLPEAVVSAAEPFLVIGAMAGG